MGETAGVYYFRNVFFLQPGKPLFFDRFLHFDGNVVDDHPEIIFLLFQHTPGNGRCALHPGRYRHPSIAF